MTTLPLSLEPAGRTGAGPYRSGNGAGNRARTGDLNLGKVTLYQLSYSRFGTAGILPPPPPAVNSGRGPRAVRLAGRQPTGFESRASNTPITAMYSPENASPMIRYGNHGRLWSWRTLSVRSRIWPVTNWSWSVIMVKPRSI